MPRFLLILASGTVKAHYQPTAKYILLRSPPGTFVSPPYCRLTFYEASSVGGVTMSYDNFDNDNSLLLVLFCVHYFLSNIFSFFIWYLSISFSSFVTFFSYVLLSDYSDDLHSIIILGSSNSKPKRESTVGQVRRRLQIWDVQRIQINCTST